jgi:hypothetical protein
VTVAGLDGAGVALDIRTLGITNVNGPDPRDGSFSAVGRPRRQGTWWIHPDFLATIADGEADGISVRRMPYTIRGVTYDAIRFQYDRPDAKRASVYDLATGILLYAGTAASGALSGAFTRDLGRGTQAILSQSTFVATVNSPPMANEPRPQMGTHVPQSAPSRDSGRHLPARRYPRSRASSVFRVTGRGTDGSGNSATIRSAVPGLLPARPRKPTGFPAPPIRRI